MKTGWTGGQYSLFRVLLGMAMLTGFFTWMQPPEPLPRVSVLGVIVAIPFTIGFRDRYFALILFICALGSITPAGFVACWILLAHLLLPAAPYGSWDARGRVDPRGDWAIPYPLAFRLLFPHLFLLDPGWVRPSERGSVDDVFYDGSCGLCHRAIRFLIAEDRSGTAFRFAPLGGEAFQELVGNVDGLPDSIVVKTPSGALLTKSDAALHLSRRLGGWWRVLATLAAIVPRPLRNAVYDFIARIRYRLFARPKDACPILPPDLRKRFSA
jgi:predicted DCC family thiol-disulfide oxidoreductase YuxK